MNPHGGAAGGAPPGSDTGTSSDPVMRESDLYAKADAIFHEYNVLLTGQLEAQREYFETQAAAATAR